MSGISAISSIRPINSVANLTETKATPPASDLQVREKFQDFVAGTFYQTMIKALRSGEQKPAYFHGGQAEEIFKGQLDEQLSSQMARDHGETFAGPLYAAYARSQPTLARK